MSPVPPCAPCDDTGKQTPVFVLAGPTGSGKTDLLLQLFGTTNHANLTNSRLKIQAEVVSADSMQVYRGMDIGTAKPSSELRAALPHHLIDIRNPDESFNVGDFVRLADEACADIAARGRLPVVSGGTGFYLKNFVLGLSEAPPSDAAVRAEVKRSLAEKGAAALHAELAAIDPASAARIHPNDAYRLTRALEVCRLTGKPLSSFAANAEGRGVSRSGRPEYRFLIVELSRPRGELYRRIDSRCEAMFAAGLADEVRGLFARGYAPGAPGMRAIGYREFFVEEFNHRPHGQHGREGKGWKISEDIEGVKALVARNSRRYAKRQLTFFAGLPGAVKVDAGGAAERERALDLLADFLHTG